MCPNHHYKTFLQTLVLLMVLCPTSRVGVRPTSSMKEKFEASLARKPSQFEAHLGALASISTLVQGFNRFENSILSLAKSVATITNKISSVEQVVGGLAARVAACKAGAASASSVSSSGRSWPSLGQVDASTAAGSHDPGSAGEGRNTRRRLGTF